MGDGAKIDDVASLCQLRVEAGPLVSKATRSAQKRGVELELHFVLAQRLVKEGLDLPL